MIFVPGTGLKAGTARLGAKGPSVGGNYTFTVDATNGYGPDTTQSFTVHVLAISPPVSASFSKSGPPTQSISITTTGAGAGVTLSVVLGSYTGGLVFHDNGNGTVTISGQPHASDRTARGPRTDGWGRTSRPGVLAAGNLVHPGETAGIAALGGIAAARRLADPWTPGLSSEPIATSVGLGLTTAAPLRWVVPALADPADLPDRLRLRTGEFGVGRLVVARQCGSEIGRHRLWHATPHRSLSVPGSILAEADHGGEAVELSLR